MFEETQNGTVDELIAHFEAKPVKGEIVMVIDGKKQKKGKDAAEND
jgi:16S rRNA (cytidine1402-2'-O)-methyltransferase